VPLAGKQLIVRLIRELNLLTDGTSEERLLTIRTRPKG